VEQAALEPMVIEDLVNIGRDQARTRTDKTAGSMLALAPCTIQFARFTGRAASWTNLVA
jgi:hypothetical protein